MSINLVVLMNHFIFSHRMKSISAEIFFLTLFLLMNILIVAWDSMLRHTEMASKIKSLINVLEGNYHFQIMLLPIDYHIVKVLSVRFIFFQNYYFLSSVYGWENIVFKTNFKN